jgi:carboxyl-terminal processing protease
MSRWNLAWLLGIPAVFLVGLAVSHSAPLREKDKDYELVRLMVEVLSEVDTRYVRELDKDGKRKLVEDMINGGLERLDPHSTFINPKRYKQFAKDSKGKFGGVGIQISTDRQSGMLAVVSPLVGTPAYEAGVLAGDIITKIDGKTTENMQVSEAVELIQGDPDTEITLTVLHEGTKEPLDLKMKRAEIQVQSVMGDTRNADNSWNYMLDEDSKIGYIRLVAFNETSAAELKTVVEGLQKQNVRGLILDLRNNPGGLLLCARDVADLFLTEGRIVSTKGRDREDEIYDAHEAGTLLVPYKDYPMVVLVNKYSASASEIVAAALQDHQRAVVIGERSYGKGSVQNIIKMENGASALKLTTASYWRPSGKNIHRFPDAKESDEWGVKPDKGFEIPMKDEERLEYMINRRDRDIIHGKPGSQAPSKPKVENEKDKDKDKEKDKEKKPFEDRVLKRGLEHLKEQIKKAGAKAPVLEDVGVGQ